VDELISIAPKASVDGRTVVFHGGPATATVPEIHRLNVADGRITQTTRENGAVNGTLSPDGRTVFFQRITGTPAKLVSMPLDGGLVATVFEAATIFDYDVSPDGSRIAVTSNAGTGSPRTVSLVPAAGGAARTIFTTPAALVTVRWYPSGNALLLLIGENRQVNMYRLDVAGGTPRQLTNFARGSIAHPDISPDGRRIAYFRGRTESDIVLLKPKADTR
jgi:Tol biopolymer transport system component